MDKTKLKRVFKITAFGVLTVLLIFTILVTIFCFLVLYSNISLNVIPKVSTVLGALSLFFSAYITSRVVNKRGLLIGAIFGLITSVVIILLNFFVNGIIFSFGELTKILVIFVSSCLGGVFGVNSKN